MAIVSCHVAAKNGTDIKEILGEFTNPRFMLTRKLRRHANRLFFLISRIPETAHGLFFDSQLIRPAEIVVPSATDQKYGFAQFGEDDVNPTDKYGAVSPSTCSR